MELTGTTNRFQHYELLRRADGTPWELGRGTMGVTYKAFDVNLRCEVALKVVNPALIHHPNARERFIREARAAARLRHRNIATVYHLGQDGERFFYAMEFIDGETLDALVRGQGPLAPDAALRVLLQVARALAAAARQGVIHRDIKPGNLMVVHEDDDDHRVVKLIDFGLARATAADEEAGNLTANGFVGTPVYSSPEQMAEKPADARSDIYSLGVTAWFLLAGRPPFNGTVASIFQAHATRPPPWEALPAAVPAPLRALLARMLEKNPARRPQSAMELRQEIDACRAGLGGATPPAAIAARAELPAVREPAAPAVLPRKLGPGMILKGRYELLRPVGEGNSGQVFEVRDRAANDERRALKVLRPELTEGTSKRESVAEEVRLIQAAAHPNLIRLHAFEHLGSRTLDFLVEEWLRGFTLLDLLAARGGALPVAEALQILAPAAAAVDHAVGQNLDRLDLALHQLHVHFPKLPPAAPEDTAARDLMARPVSGWPAWTLKVNPLGAARGGLEAMTWAGELTHLPGASPALERDQPLDEPAASPAASYLRGLARALYETLGGTPGMVEAARDHRVKGVSLPAIGEEANAVLQRALSGGEARYASCREFCSAFAAATGNRLLPVRTDPAAPTVAATGRVRENAGMSGLRPGPKVIGKPEAEPGLPNASVANLLGGSEAGLDGEPFASKTGVWERLTLVSTAGPRDRSWLPALTVAAALALGSAVVMFAAFAHRNPQPKPAVARSGRAAPAHPVATPRLAASPTPATVKPSPMAQTVSNDAPVRSDASTPAPAVELAPPAFTPPPLPSAPTPRVTPVKVRVESRPSGAEIRLAGKLLGTTPLTISLPPGDHPLSARYRNWSEVQHTLHLDSDQLTALEEIHMAPPTTMIPPTDSPASPGVKKHPVAAATPRRDTPRPTPIPNGNAVVHFPTPTTSVPPATRGPEPFLAQPTPFVRRNRPGLTPFDPDGTSDPAPRRRSTEPVPADPDDN